MASSDVTALLCVLDRANELFTKYRQSRNGQQPLGSADFQIYVELCRQAQATDQIGCSRPGFDFFDWKTRLDHLCEICLKLYRMGSSDGPIWGCGGSESIPHLNKERLMAMSSHKLTEFFDSVDSEFAQALMPLVKVLNALRQADSTHPQLTVGTKGKSGRRGYPRRALDYARQLRTEHPAWKVQQIRVACLKIFGEDDLPSDAEAFRRWLNRVHKD